MVHYPKFHRGCSRQTALRNKKLHRSSTQVEQHIAISILQKQLTILFALKSNYFVSTCNQKWYSENSGRDWKALFRVWNSLRIGTTKKLTIWTLFLSFAFVLRNGTIITRRPVQMKNLLLNAQVIQRELFGQFAFVCAPSSQGCLDLSDSVLNSSPEPVIALIPSHSSLF